MNKIRQLLCGGGLVGLMFGLPALSHATIITLGDGQSKYEIYLQSHNGNTWTYFVREVAGKSLSHWNLGIQSCMDKDAVVGSSPTGDVEDGSTSFKGMKWNVGDGFTEGTFSITLNGDYPEATIKAQAKAGEPGNERTGVVIGPDCTAVPLPPQDLPSVPPNVIDDDEPPARPAGIGGDCNTIYAVHDKGLNDTQIVTIGTSEVEELGSIHIGLDIEGLDVATDGFVCASSGDDTNQPGRLYEVDPDTGDVYSMGDICFDFPGTTGIDLASGLEAAHVCDKEVSSISFNPIDDSLWGWAEECGLIEIDLDDPENSRLVFAYPHDGGVTCLTKNPRDVTPIVEDMTWDNNGEKIYYALGKVPGPGSEVWVYNASTQAVRMVANMGGNVEALEMLPEFDDKLLVNQHNSPTLMVLYIPTGTFTSSPVTVGEFNDIEAIGTCLGDDAVPPMCIMGEGGEWMYTTDSINDSTGTSPESRRVKVGNSYFEIYGLAVKMDDDTVTVAINSRLPVGGVPYHGAQISWGDLVFDFEGKKYGVRFDSSNDSLDGNAALGLYEVTELKSVTKANKGHTNFTTYKNYVQDGGGEASLGDLPILDNGYFGNTDKMPTSIKTGIKVAGDGFEMLDAAQLAAKGLDFVTNLGIPASTYDPANPFSRRNKKPANELGEYTVGFSFNRQDDMTGAFKAFIFTECGNDGILMDNTLPSCE